jgi:hypothetical protein
VTDAFRIVIRSLVATASVTVLLVAAAPVGAASPCAEQIIDDWADNATIDGTYQVECYRQAIAGLPDDLQNYSSAGDDINRALQARLQGEADPGPPASGGSGGGASGSGGSDGGGSSSGGSDEREPAGEGSQDGNADGASGANGDDGGQDGAVPQGAEGAIAAPDDQLFQRNLGDGSSSLPTPVIVLLAVAGAVALGVAAWLMRRQLGRRSAGG